MEKKPVTSSPATATVAALPETVNFVEGDGILPLPTFVTTATLSELFDMHPSDTLESLLFPSNKNN